MAVRNAILVVSFQVCSQASRASCLPRFHTQRVHIGISSIVTVPRNILYTYMPSLDGMAAVAAKILPSCHRGCVGSTPKPLLTTCSLSISMPHCRILAQTSAFKVDSGRCLGRGIEFRFGSLGFRV